MISGELEGHIPDMEVDRHGNIVNIMGFPNNLQRSITMWEKFEFGDITHHEGIKCQITMEQSSKDMFFFLPPPLQA